MWVLASSPVWSLHAGAYWLPKPDYVVAADGGSALANKLGLVPDLLIGDFDSSDPALIKKWEGQGVAIRRFEHTVKLETDTELAVLAALEWHPARVYIIGAVGGRLDHEFANILLLTALNLAALDIRIIDNYQEVFLAKPGQWNMLCGREGDSLSLLPVGGDVQGVTTEGLEYPLLDETLHQGRGRGVSNTLLAPEARVWFDKGLLMVVHLHTGTRAHTQGVKE